MSERFFVTRQRQRGERYKPTAHRASAQRQTDRRTGKLFAGRARQRARAMSDDRSKCASMHMHCNAMNQWDEWRLARVVLCFTTYRVATSLILSWLGCCCVLVDFFGKRRLYVRVRIRLSLIWCVLIGTTNKQTNKHMGECNACWVGSDCGFPTVYLSAAVLQCTRMYVCIRTCMLCTCGRRVWMDEWTWTDGMAAWSG